MMSHIKIFAALAHIEDTTGLADALGGGNVSVTLSVRA